MKHFILGGVKSGKSKYAELKAQEQLDSGLVSTIILIATAQALDNEMAQRIERHRADRSGDWKVIEEPIYLSKALEGHSEKAVIVIDCITLWLTNLLMLENEDALSQEVDSFLEALRCSTNPIIIVSNETNMGIMPLGDLTRRYCDVAGTLHQKIAAICDNVDLVLAGLPMHLKSQNGDKEQRGLDS